MVLEGSGVFLLCLQGILSGAELLLQHPCSSIVPGQVPSGSGWLWLMADTGGARGVGRMMLQLPGTALLPLLRTCARGWDSTELTPWGFGSMSPKGSCWQVQCWPLEPVWDAVLLLFLLLSLLLQFV